MKTFVAAAILIASGALCSHAAAASLDCARATAPDERAVCEDSRLSDLDSALGRANTQARAQAGREGVAKLTIVARGIMADRRACGTAWGCLAAVYLGGLQSYQEFGSTVPVTGGFTALEIAGGAAPESRRLPARPGQCVTTRVVGIGARLEGEPPGSFESGTSVDFANGGHQVSYEQEAGIIASRPGDPVVMCLTSIPRACPPGDDRGRVYIVTSLRNRLSWLLPDSQHMCGGA